MCWMDLVWQLCLRPGQAGASSSALLRLLFYLRQHGIYQTSVCIVSAWYLPAKRLQYGTQTQRTLQTMGNWP